MTPPTTDFCVGILIGGHSRRMGQPKALIPIDGRTLLERTVDVARSICEHILLLGQPPFELPAALRHVRILPDPREGIGPIAGLESMFRAYANLPALLISCDLPHLHASLLRRLVDSFAQQVQAVVYSADGSIDECEPCCGLYSPDITPALAAQIASGQFGLRQLLRSVRTTVLIPDAADATALTNMNSPADVPPSARRDLLP